MVFIIDEGSEFNKGLEVLFNEDVENLKKLQ